MDTLGSESVAWAGYAFLKAVLILCGGLFMGVTASRFVRQFASRRFSPAQAEVAGRLVVWAAFALSVLSALRELGFDLSVFMGAAGLLTVAIGFASQTSASNLISGLFLLFERPFTLRDVIRVSGTTGEVVSIDLLSVRLRTFDNLLVRVPNETLLKSEITNLSHFPIRRFDLQVGVHYRHDLDGVFEMLIELADSLPIILDEPRPVIHFIGFQDSAIALQVSVWATREDFLEVRNGFPRLVHRAFAERGIEIPFPQRVVTTVAPTSLPPIREPLPPE